MNIQDRQERDAARSRSASPRRRQGLDASRWTKALALALTGAALVSFDSGCARKTYRADADREVYSLLNTVDKTSEKYWELENFTLQESRGSRYANRYDPDAQPAPFDDATAARLMADVEGRKGQKKWSKNGFTQTVENQNWRNTLPAPNENGEIVIDQKVAFDLALLHSPDYRSALENVYLSALNVTAERYAFDVKFYGGSSLFYTHDGSFKKGEGVSTLDAGTADVGASRKLATGADVVVNLANSMVWTFSPDNQTFTPTTSLSYSITQPFLRGAGRAIVLEDLTRSERRLLANVRQLAFYQQGFYVGVLTGSSPVQAPSSGGYPGSGVGGASVGGFYGLLSNQIRIRNQESNVWSSLDNYNRYQEYFAASRVTDRTDVDRMRQNWLTSQKSLIELKDNYRDAVEEYLMDLGLPPDVENVVVRDPLLDQFNLMPETLDELQTDLSTLLSWLRNRGDANSEGGASEIVGDFNRRYINSVADLKSENGRVRQLSVADLRAIFARMQQQYVAGLTEVRADVERLEKEVAPRRRAALVSMRERFQEENPELNSSFADVAGFDERVAGIRSDLENPEEILKNGFVKKARGVQFDVEKMFELISRTILDATPDELAAAIAEKRSDPTARPFAPEVEKLVEELHMQSELNDPIQFNADELEAEIARLDEAAQHFDDATRAQYEERRARLQQSITALKSGALVRDDIYRFWFSSCLTKLAEELMTLRLVQARARLESIELAIVDVDAEYAFNVARERRLDWMNVRSNLVDQWRNIEIVADQLRGDLKVSIGGSISNEGQNPLNFSAKNSRLTTGVQFDAPLDRFLERNSYRQALISYDQARRQYYSYVDQTHQQIRSAIRAIELAQISFELQRDSVLTSIKRVHSAQLDLTKPPTGSSRVGSVNSNAEALTNALETLLSSQNEIMQTWLQYQSRRMNLMLLLGVFNLDATGRWVDPGNIDEALLQRIMSDVDVPQDRLTGVDRLPTFEQLSGGRSPEAVRQMTGDGPNANVGTAASVGTVPATPAGVATTQAAPLPTPQTQPQPQAQPQPAIPDYSPLPTYSETAPAPATVPADFKLSSAVPEYDSIRQTSFEADAVRSTPAVYESAPSPTAQAPTTSANSVAATRRASLPATIPGTSNAKPESTLLAQPESRRFYR